MFDVRTWVDAKLAEGRRAYLDERVRELMTWQEREEAVIAQGCLTYSKRADQYVQGVYPTHVLADTGYGDGVHILSADGVVFIDFVCGLGANICAVRVDLARTNNSYSLPTTLEVEVAERIVSLFPVDKIRFLKTGSEACSAAIRIARAHTGRKVVIGMGYHGWHNTFISEEQPGAGCVYEFYIKVPNLRSIIATLNCWDTEMGTAPAAVIIEPMMLDVNVGDELRRLREQCTAMGIVLIFDEVITGMRVPRRCVANWLNVKPDILCLGKAIADGYPLSVVGGSRAVMDTPDYFVSSTFAGEVSSLRACERVLDYMSDGVLAELWERGKAFQAKFNALCPDIQLVGIPTRATWQGDEAKVNLFWQEMCKRRYLLGKAWFLHVNHTPAILAKFLVDAKEAIADIQAGKVKLEGKPRQEMFKRY